MVEGSRTPCSFPSVTLLGSKCFEIHTWRPEIEQGGYFLRTKPSPHSILPEGGGKLSLPLCPLEHHWPEATTGPRLLSAPRLGEVPHPRTWALPPSSSPWSQGGAISSHPQPHHFQSPAQLLQ